jgi:hypothetical protein
MSARALPTVLIPIAGILMSGILPIPATAFPGSEARLEGRVTTVFGLAIPDATIRLESMGREMVRQATTNTEGTFVLKRLEPGSYMLRIALDGFQGCPSLSVGDFPRNPVDFSVGVQRQRAAVRAHQELVARPRSKGRRSPLGA